VQSSIKKKNYQEVDNDFKCICQSDVDMLPPEINSDVECECSDDVDMVAP